jgi:hypothetical protein
LISLNIQASAVEEIIETTNEVAATANFLSDNEKKLSQCVVPKNTVNTQHELVDSTTNEDFKLLGQARFSVLFWDIYDSKLLTSDGEKPFSNVCQYSLFEIHYLRDISKKELLDNTVAQWRHLAIKEAEYKAFVPVLADIWPDLKAGDRLSMLNQVGMTDFYLNSKKIGEIKSLDFAKTFLRIWLDENTSEPKLREQLLGDSI